MNDFQATDYLTWEYSTDPSIQYLNCARPESVRNHMPTWFKDLKARRSTVDIAEQKTVRNCVGFRGLVDIGYTIPLPEAITLYDTYFNRGRLHPDMLSGTEWAHCEPGRRWAEDDTSPYKYGIRLLCWPWRARMAPGWRLLILPYLLDWNANWQEFAGAVEPNHEIEQGTGLGVNLVWHQTIDTRYNYYNLETVVAVRRDATIATGTPTFTAVPIYDPEMKNAVD